MKRSKTPQELAKERVGKDKYSLYLDVELMNLIKEEANKAEISPSKVVNQAIAEYVSNLKDKNRKN